MAITVEITFRKELNTLPKDTFILEFENVVCLQTIHLFKESIDQRINGYSYYNRMLFQMIINRIF